MNPTTHGVEPVVCDNDPAAVNALVQKNGVALLRGPVRTFGNFITLSDTLMIPVIHHATNTIERDPVDSDPRTSTVNKGMDEIPLHREGSYAPACPDLLMLFCERPADHGGQTIVCDGLRLYDMLPAHIKSYIATLDLYWSWIATPERWSQTLGTGNPREAEIRLAHLQSTLKPWEALDARFEGEMLRGRFKTRCCIPYPDEDHLAFCNSLMIHAYRTKSEYYARELFYPSLGDGTEFPADLLAEIALVARSVSQQVVWEVGDILIFDNARIMHGRKEFDDPARRVLIRMGHFRSPA